MTPSFPRHALGRALSFALALTIALAISPALGDIRGPGGAFAPQANAVQEEGLLQNEARITGDIQVLDRRAAVLIQPEGRGWEYFQETILHWFGAIAILGVLALLAAAYLLLGPLRLRAGRSGKTVQRYTPFERFAHWLTATSFVLLALTGLNVTFGKFLIYPIIGGDMFSQWAQLGKYAHNFLSFAFMVGLSLLCAKFFRDNIPDRTDLEWIRRGGGFIKTQPVSAKRFNAGEKGVFWLSTVAGLAVTISGLLLLFPFYVLDIGGMQIAHMLHAFVAILFIVLIIAHAYSGTLGMEGAFEAMGAGEVDVNWAREHHDLWLDEQLARKPAAPAE